MRKVRSIRGGFERRAGVVLGTLAMLTIALGHSTSAQVGTQLKSGLHTFPQHHTARLAVVELGAPLSASRVVIDFRDARDRVVARTAGVLRRGEPVQLDLPVVDGQTQLRATVTIYAAAGSRPSTTFEDVDVLVAVPKVVCGPPSGRDSPQAYCPGWEATSFVP